jgi:electron transport complex protein RnfE
VPDHPGFLLAMLPPGAFIGLGLLIAGRKWLDGRSAARKAEKPARAMNESIE